MKTDFFNWYTKKAKEYDGLLTPANAAKMIGISTQHLNRIIETGRITKHYFEKTPFIGLTEVYEEIQRRQARKHSKESYQFVIASIYPQPELNKWLNELQGHYKTIMGGASEDQRREFLDEKLQEWKKTDDPDRIKLLAEKTKKITLKEWKDV